MHIYERPRGHNPSSKYVEVRCWSRDHFRQAACSICGSLKNGRIQGNNCTDSGSCSTVEYDRAYLRLKLICSWHFSEEPKKIQMWDEAHMVAFALTSTTDRLLHQLLGALDTEYVWKRFKGEPFVVWTKRVMSRKDSARFEESVIHEIWENEQGFDAFEQLFALACIRTRRFVWYRDRPEQPQ